MGFINVIVKHDGTAITNSTISYNRDHQICSGIGTLELLVPLNIGRTFKPWDVIEIWESGDKKGKFFVDSVSKSAKEGAIQIKATDGSKRLSDYFITDTYTIDYLSYGRTWIEKFLDEAGVSYSFTVSGNGSPLSNNTSLGYDSAFSTITTLLQQSGWYLYFNNDGTAIIGDLHKDVSNPDHTINASDFSELMRELDDDRLRNRAVVWGNSNPTFGEVFVDISVQTPWNYDAQDKRAVVLSNSSIYNNAQARTLAIMMLNEFTQIKDEKTLLVLNDYNLQIGEILKINSKYWSGRGLITGITASFSKDGLTYQVTINQKCPRLFTFFSTLPPTISGFYVYIGTTGDGIWRKYTADSSWYNDSSGLEDLKINDLAIRNGNFATIADDGYLYTRTSEFGFWNKYTPPNLRDVSGVTYSNMDLRAVACSTNFSDNIVAGYNFVPVSGIVASGVIPSGMSWVLELTGGQSLIRAEQVVISGGTGFYDNKYSIYDLESTGEYNIVSVSGFAPVSGFIPDAVDEYWNSGAGYRTMQIGGSFSATTNLIPRIAPDSDSLSLGWGYGNFSTTSLTGPNSSWAKSKYICDTDSTTYWYVGWDGFLVKLDADAKTTTTWNFTQPAEWSSVSPINFRWNCYLKHKSTNLFDIIVILNTSGNNWELYHYSYTLGDSTLTTLSTKSFTETVSQVGFIGNDVIFHTLSGDEVRVKIYNLISTTFITTTYFKATDYSPNYAAKMFMGSSGDSIIVGSLWTLGYDYQKPSGCSGDVPLELRIMVAGYRVTKNGSKTILGPTTIYTLTSSDLPAGTDSWYLGVGTSCVPYVFGVTTNTNLRKMYTIGGIGIVARSCNFSVYKYAAFTLGISFPDLSSYYFKWSDGGPWWDEEDEYFSPDSSELIGKRWSGGVSIFKTPYFSGGLSSKYAGSYFYIYRSGVDVTSLFELRGCPAYGTAFWSSTSAPALQLYQDILLDDLTRQIPPITDSSAPLDMVLPYNLNYITSTYNVSTLSSFYWHFSQKYLIVSVGNRWRIYFPSSYAIDDFPKGTILKHTSTTELGTKITASEDSLEQTMGIFEIIKTTQVPTKVDIAQGVPTVIYDIPQEDGLDSQEFWGSTQNEVDTFYTHADPKPVYESRVFSLPNPGSFPTVSGEFNPTDYERYIGISNREGILASHYHLDTPWVNLVTVYSGVAVSGLITHFETSNFVPEGTYFFYTVSGVKSFFQKNPEENYWKDYSIGLPDSPITIIRCDDII